jgi:hypothetical protein
MVRSELSWIRALVILGSNFKLIMACRFGLVRTSSFLLVASFPSVVAPSSSHIYLRTTNVAHLGSITFSYVFKLILARKACTSCWSFLA